VPAAFVLAAIVIVYLARYVPADVRFVPSGAVPDGALSRGEKVTLGAFGLALVGWMLPTALRLLDVPGGEVLAGRLHVGAVALLATGPLFLLRDAEGTAILPWREASQIDWGIIMLFAGGICLGDAMLSTGLAEVLAHVAVEGTGVQGLWSLTALLLVVAVVLTEFCSNTASASILVPLAIAAAVELGVSPIPPALAVGLGSSCGFMLPVATGPNALAYGSGQVEAREMMRHGLFLDVAGALAIYVLLRVLCPLLGFV
jgi:sodium-dependent dicarboxylate transporter 2/3/5